MITGKCLVSQGSLLHSKLLKQERYYRLLLKNLNLLINLILFYLIQFGLLAGEGEGKSNWELLVFDVLFFHEVTETLCHMVKQLEKRWKEGEAVSG